MAIHTIFVQNMSGHDQQFQIHGWNDNQDLVVKANTTANISAADGSSGAIIAVHDGQIGEQAEITKSGYMGNDFIDMSNICGAGGNMIVQQVNSPDTRKGDPLFMQHCQTAWDKASAETKNDLSDCVHVRDGKVVRISAIKDYPKLEQFVRSFADGMTYIGVGSWNGSPGNSNDNNQSSAAQGSKDILVTYNDGDATPKSASKKSILAVNALSDSEPTGEKEDDGEGTVEAAVAPAPKEAEDEVDIAAATAALATSSPFHTLMAVPSIAANDPGPGINLTNKSNKDCEYFFYDNYWNGDGTAGANFDHPLKSVKLNPGQSTFVSLPASFKGRVQRGTQLPCTWVEFQLEASNDHAAHGDISLQQGCDGAATIASTDGSNRENGFTNDVVSGAPANACRNKPNGEKALDTTVGNWMGGPNQATIDYLNKVVGQSKAYIVGGTGVPDVASNNKRMAVDMY